MDLRRGSRTRGRQSKTGHGPGQIGIPLATTERQPLTQGCFWSPQYSNWFYCGSQWAGHYVPDQDANGWWWYQRKSDQAWYYMFAAQDAAGGWFFKPYEDSADCGTETDELMNASTYLEGNEILLNNHISGILE